MSSRDHDLPDPLDVLQRLEDLERHTAQIRTALRIVLGPNADALALLLEAFPGSEILRDDDEVLS